MKKKLGQLKINAERVIDNDELINIKGGHIQCYCQPLGGWITASDWPTMYDVCPSAHNCH